MSPYPVAASRGKNFGSPAIPWHLILPSANGLAAFQPYGAASYAVSKVNLFGVAANDAADGAAYPSFDTSYGWNFVIASSQYLTVGSGALAQAVPLTFACLVYPKNDTSVMELLTICRTSTASNGFRLRLSGNVAGDPVRATTFQDNTTGSASSSTGFAQNQWYTVIGVFSAVDARAVYINGSSKGTDTTSKTPSGTLDVTAIGAGHDGSAFHNFLQARMGACGIWNMAANDAQVAALSAAMMALVA